MLTQEERDAIAVTIRDAAFFYDKEIDRPFISRMLQVIEGAFPRKTGTEIINSIRAYMRDPKNTQFPAPARLSPYLNPEPPDDALANEVAGRVHMAISKFGWPSPQKAREYIGELGWSVVESFGGWQYVCENLGVDLSVTTFRAQVRDSAKGKLALDRIGELNQPIGLPSQRREEISVIEKLKLQGGSECSTDQNTSKGLTRIGFFGSTKESGS